jgi:hypothetical protein
MPSPIPQVQFVDHGGRQILVVDLRNSDRQAHLGLIQEFNRLLEGKAPNSIRLLGITAAYPDFYPDIAGRWRAALLANKEKITRSAMVGFSGIFKVAALSYLRLASLLGSPLSKERGVPFDSEEAALNWLAS